MVNGMKISHMLRSRRQFWLAGICWLMPVLSAAGELSDPTLPPVSIAAPLDESIKVKENQPVGLQFVLISPHRRAAIIDGQTVELGGRFGGGKLIEVNETNVVLKTPQGRQVLTLYPDVNMTKNKVAAKASAANVRTGHKPSPDREKK